MKKIILSFLIFGFFYFAAGAGAIGKMSGNLKQAGQGAGLVPKKQETKEDLPTRVGKIINYLLGIIGTLAVIYAIYGGSMWITAGGNQEKVKIAQKILVNAVIGIIAVGMAYLIVSLAIAAGSGSLFEPEEAATDS